MTKSRLEAFSDGVFAIAITLLILEIHVPVDLSPDRLAEGLIDLLPSLGIYVMSFFVIGLYWVVHHRYVQMLKTVNGKILWVNLVWLMFVSVIPFPTSLVGEYPLQVLPIVIYGANLILANLSGFFVMLYCRAHPEMLHESVSPEALARRMPRYLITNGLYAVAIALAWFVPVASYVIYLAVLLWLIWLYLKE